MMWLSDFCELCVVALTENLNRGIAVNYEQLAGAINCADSVTQARYPRDNCLQMKEWLLRQSGCGSLATVLRGPRESLTVILTFGFRIFCNKSSRRKLKGCF